MADSTYTNALETSQWIKENQLNEKSAIELNALEELFNNIGRFSPAGLGQ